MELKQIKELMAAMGRTGIKRVVIKKESFELTLEREEQAGGRLADSNFDFSDETLKQNAPWSRAEQAL